MLSLDQKPEWTAAGYLPKWTVTFDDQAAGFRIDGDEQGAFRGTVLIGQPIELPDPMPCGLRFRLRFKTSCKLDDPSR